MNIFKQFFRSLYSPKDIASFRFQGIGKTILFVFFLSLISIVPSVYYLNTAINDAFEATKETIKKDLPAFTIENGTLQSSENAPLTINSGHFSIIFDSTGSMNKENLSNTGDTLALLKNEIVLSAGGEVNSFPYSMLAIKSLTKQDIEAFLESSDSALIVFMAIFSVIIYLFSSTLKFIEISTLALVGVLLKNISKRELQYRHLWRMTAYSVTLPTVFFTIMAVLQTSVPFGSLISWFVSLTMLLLAIQEIPNSKESAE